MTSSPRRTQAMIACGAIPLYAWLDGASQGEQQIEELLVLLIAKGVAGINIVPDRNWNFSDPKVQAAKVHELYRVVELARSLDLPIIVGTEMNKAGQRLVDDFEAEPLRPLRGDFLQGADFLYGHTVMQRALGQGYQSEWARTHLPRRRERNAFYVTWAVWLSQAPMLWGAWPHSTQCRAPRRSSPAWRRVEGLRDLAFPDAYRYCKPQRE